MATNNRIPPPHLRRPIPSPRPMHPDPYAPPVPIHHHHPPGNFPPFEMFPPPELMEQKLSAQHVEIQKLATENQRLAATHGTLRQDLAAAKHELQLIHMRAADMMSQQDQQMRGLVDKISVMEAELKDAEPIKLKLQKAHAEAKSLVDARQDLILKVQQLTNDLQKAHTQTKQIPALLSELDGLRQEYHHCRATYDYEKKLCSDHLESLQVMEKNYMAMSREVEKLRAELTNSSNFDPRTGVQYGGPGVYNDSVNAGKYVPAQNAYGVGQHGHSPFMGGGNESAASASGTGITGTSAQGNSPHIIAQTGPSNSTQTTHDPTRGSGQNTFLATGYDPYGRLVVAGYDPQRMQQTATNYDSHRQPTLPPAYNVSMGHSAAYDPHRGQLVYDMQRGSANEAQTGANYDFQKPSGYESSSRVPGGAQGQVPTGNAMPYGSAAPGNRAGIGYEMMSRTGNQAPR